MFGLILLLFSAYLGSSSELDLDISLVGGREGGREARQGGVISPLLWYSAFIVILARCYPLYSWYWVWVITITDITHQHISYHPPSPPLFPLVQSKSNLPQILHTHWCPSSPHIHHGNGNVNQEQLFNFVSHHSLPAYRDCSMEIDCLSENWSSCRYSSYLSAWRTLEIQKIETRNQSEPTFYYGRVSLSAKTEFPHKRLFLWQLSISIFL